MRSKTILCFVLFLLVAAILVTPSLAAKAGESCMNDDDCDGSLECIDGECAGGFTKFLHNQLGGWMGVLHFVIMLLLILGVTMTGFKAVFKDTGKWSVLVGIALSIAGTVTLHMWGVIATIFNLGIGLYVLAILIIGGTTILYFFLTKMHKHSAERAKEGASASKEKSTAELKKKSRKVKKITRKMWHAGTGIENKIKDLDKTLEKADESLEAATNLNPPIATPPPPAPPTGWAFRRDIYDGKRKEGINSLKTAKKKAEDITKEFEDLFDWAKYLRKTVMGLKSKFRIGESEAEYAGIGESEIDYAMKTSRLDFKKASELKTKFNTEVIAPIDAAIIGCQTSVANSIWILVGTVPQAQASYNTAKANINAIRNVSIKNARDKLKDYTELAIRLAKLANRVRKLAEKGVEEAEE